MAENSKIEWTTHTFNPWEGCTEVSPGCLHCYAAARNARFGGGTAPNWGKGAPRRRTSPANWKLPLKWDREYLEEIDEALHCFGEESYIAPQRPRVFCASLADWLDDEVPIEWLVDLLELIGKTPGLDWLLLTKRPQNWTSRLEAALRSLNISPAGDTRYDWAVDWLERRSVPHNVWIGTTVEDQTRADERIPRLLNIPAQVRFLSCEPLLGAVDLRRWLSLRLPDGGCSRCGFLDSQQGHSLHCPAPQIHWVIIGGESGPGARPMHPDWARSIRDQCVDAGVSVLFKQWGEWSPNIPPDGTKWLPEQIRYAQADGAIAKIGEGHEPGPLLYRMGKHAAGRVLDGKTWGQFPIMGGANA